MDVRALCAFDRIDRAELRFCRVLNRSSQLTLVSAIFRCASKVGDGWLWYAWIAALPLAHPIYGPGVSIQLVFTGAVGVLLYKLIKNRAVRERPFITHSSINCAAAPLDRYSFPSGHTMHAVSFSIIIATAFPQYTPALVVATCLIAFSRVILGLHYPSDVIAGGFLGAALASISIQGIDWLASN